MLADLAEFPTAIRVKKKSSLLTRPVESLMDQSDSS